MNKSIIISLSPAWRHSYRAKVSLGKRRLSSTFPNGFTILATGITTQLSNCAILQRSCWVLQKNVHGLDVLPLYLSPGSNKTIADRPEQTKGFIATA
jgi:hypothetical protein